MKKGAKIWTGFGAIALVALGVSYFLFKNSDIAKAADLLPSELEKARQAGLALEPSDLRKSSTEQARDTGNIYRTLGETGIHDSKKLNQAEALLDPNPSESEIASARAAIKWAQPILDLFVQASKSPDCDFGRNWERGSAIQFRELSDIKQGVKVLLSRAVLRAQDKDFNGSFDDLEVAAISSHHASSDPVIIGVLVQVATDNLVLAVADRILREHGASPDVRIRAKRFLARMPSLPSLSTALNGETVLAMTSLKTLAGQPLSVNFVPAQTDGMPPEARSPWGRSGTAIAAYQTRLLQHNLALASALRSSRDPMVVYEQLRKIDEQATSEPGQSYAFVRGWSPFVAGSQLAIISDQARRSVFAATIALFDQRATKGSFPAGLPASPDFVDPFDGKPLRYRKAADGYMLWSIGMNCKDDGGIGRLSRQKDKDDIVSQLPSLPNSQKPGPK